jgi:hypothetical protein
VIEVRALGAADEAAYTAFLRDRPDALLYHSLPYRDLLLDEAGGEAEYLLALEDGAIRGVLPTMHRDGVLNSLPYYGSHGGVVGEAEAALLDAWDERAAEARAATLVGNPFGPERRAPRHDLTDERLNQAVPLSPGFDVLAAAEPSAARNVRKAHRRGYVVAREPDALEELAAVHRDNLERIGGLAKDAAFFTDVARRFAPGEEYDVYTARADGELAAALLVFWIGAAAEYYTPAVVHEHRSDQPLAAILAEAIPDAAARGKAWFNFGGTWLTQDTLRRFKRKWGARTVSYRYFTKINDRSLLRATPAALRARFGDFYVAPYSALEEAS